MSKLRLFTRTERAACEHVESGVPGLGMTVAGQSRLHRCVWNRPAIPARTSGAQPAHPRQRLARTPRPLDLTPRRFANPPLGLGQQVSPAAGRPMLPHARRDPPV